MMVASLFSKSSGGLLSFNFTSGILDNRLTASGGVNGTRVNAAGLIVSASAGRFDYSPTNIGTPLGILDEPSLTNNAYPSAPTNVNGIWIGSWKGSAGALSLPGVTAPDGSTNAILFTDDTSTGAHFTVDDQSGPNGGKAGGLANVSQAYSAWIKQAPGGATSVKVLVPSYGTANNLYATLNLVTGAVTGTGASGDGTLVSATSYPWPNGWWQIVFIGTPTAAASPSPNTISTQIQANNGAGYTGTTQAQFYFWGKQSAGSFGAYIPTAGASVTRTADAISFTIPAGVNFLTYTFDNGSTQKVAVSSGAYTIPTNLNRPHIISISGTAT